MSLDVNDYARKLLGEVMGSTLPAAFDFEKDFLAQATREQLAKAIDSLPYRELQRACCLELVERGPNDEEWLRVAQTMDGRVGKRAVDHLLEHQPSLDALEYIVLAGSSTPAHRKRAAELLLNDATDATRLRFVLVRFPKGDIARRAWAFFEKQRPVDLDDLHAVLCESQEPSVLKAAWARFAAEKPTAVNLSWLVTDCKKSAIRNQAAELLLQTPDADADRLAAIVRNASTPRLLKAAAEKLLALDAKPEQLASIPIRVRDRALADAAWEKVARQKFRKGSERIYDLRNILCFSVHPHIRQAALVIAQSAPLDQSDRDFIVENATDPAVKRAFNSKTTPGRRAKTTPKR